MAKSYTRYTPEQNTRVHLNTTNDAESAALLKDVNDWIKKGGKINIVPIGASSQERITQKTYNTKNSLGGKKSARNHQPKTGNVK